VQIIIFYRVIIAIIILKIKGQNCRPAITDVAHPASDLTPIAEKVPRIAPNLVS